MSEEDLENIGAPQGKVKGRYSKEEDDFIHKNYTMMTDQEIANALNRDRKSIENRRVKLGLNNKKEKKVSGDFREEYMKNLSEDDRFKTHLKELRASATYKQLKEIMEAKELKYYEEKWVGFMMDPSIETMTMPEKDQLHELIMCQIQLLRLAKEERICLASGEKFTRGPDVRAYQDAVMKYQQQLNATRQQRLKNKTDSAMTFTNLIREMKNPELRRTLGYEAAMMKYIAEKFYNARMGSNIHSGNPKAFDVDSMFKDGKEPEGLHGRFTEIEED